MSSPKRVKPLENLPDADAVKSFLLAYPDFFEDNRTLLDELSIPHGAGGGTVSLVERQVSALRQKNLVLERKLKELIEVARDNDELVKKIHDLTLALMATTTAEDALSVVEQHLRTAFAADNSVLVLFAEIAAFKDLPKMRFVRQVSRNDEAVKPFETFLQTAKPRCGQIRDSQRHYLYQQDADDIGSAALIPLGESAGLGMLAVGSRDSDHFHAGMSTDYLSRIGEVVTAVLERLRRPGD